MAHRCTVQVGFCCEELPSLFLLGIGVMKIEKKKSLMHSICIDQTEDQTQKNTFAFPFVLIKDDVPL